jgi:hypothetical protein
MDNAGIKYETESPAPVSNVIQNSLISDNRSVLTEDSELTPRSATPTEFDSFYASFPRRIGKEAARKAFAKALKIATAEQITAGAKRYAEARRGEDPKFTKHPATWLNAGCWDDEIASAPRNAAHPGEPLWWDTDGKPVFVDSDA